VSKGGSYTIQVGGANNAGGNLEFLFDFVVPPPPRPPRLRPDITFTARGTSNGVKVRALKVESARKARVEVRCGGCPKLVKRGKTVSFKRLRGRDLAAGSKVEVRLTRRGYVGSYTAYRIGVGAFRKLTRCMNPGSTKPRRKCG
jgi:hypothetical protein